MSLHSKKSTQKWLDDKFDNAEKIKTYLPAVKLQIGMTLIIKTETTPESIKELERIKQESLDRMKN